MYALHGVSNIPSLTYSILSVPRTRMAVLPVTQMLVNFACMLFVNHYLENHNVRNAILMLENATLIIDIIMH